jgi:hypothetical protein
MHDTPSLLNLGLRGPRHKTARSHFHHADRLIEMILQQGFSGTDPGLGVLT